MTRLNSLAPSRRSPARSSRTPAGLRFAALALAAAAVSAVVGPTVAQNSGSSELIVGFKSGQFDLSIIENAGGAVLRSSAALGLALALTSDSVGFQNSVFSTGAVAFVETNDPVHTVASSWDSSSWDASSWDASSWDASSWDASSWDASSWDASSWDASSWDASSWDASSWDASSWDASRWDSSSWDASSWDGSSWDASRWDASAPPGAHATSHAWSGHDGMYEDQWAARAAGFPSAWNVTHGRGNVPVCVLDSGIDASHPDLRDNLWTAADGSHGWNAITGTTNVHDGGGHGTHVAGILAARSGNGSGIAGAAQEPIMAVKVLADNGVGDEMTLALGIEWCADHGARVLTMSLGTSLHSPAVKRAVDKAWSSGALLVASAGNGNQCSSCVGYPAAYPNVLAVSGTTAGNALASFSSTGSQVSLAAPGDRVLSTLPDGKYRIASGTSQAAPFVAAAAALVLDVDPVLTNREVWDLLNETARDLGAAGKDESFGWGLVNAPLAVRVASTHANPP